MHDEGPAARDHKQRGGGSLSSEVGAVVMGRVAVSLLDSVKSFVLLRLIAKGDYGTLAFAMAWYSTAVSLGALAVPDSLIALLPKHEPGAQRSLVRQSLGLLGGVGVVFALAIGVVAWVPGALPASQPNLHRVLPWVALAVVSDLPAQAMQAFLLGLKRHRDASLRAIALSGLANLALIVPAALGQSVQTVWICYASACMVRLGVTWATYRSCFGDVPTAPFPGGLRAQMGVAVPLSLNGLVGLGNRQLSTWVAGLLLAPAVFADFASGGQELPFVAMLPNAVAVSILPHLSARAVSAEGRREAVQLWHASMVRVALIMVPLWVLATLEAESLLVVLGGEAYRSAALPFRVTALLLPLRLTSYGSMLLALGRAGAVLRSQLWALLANVTICVAVFVLHRQGLGGDRVVLAGASASFVLAQAVAILSMLGDIAHAADIPWRAAFPWRDVGRVLAIALPPAAVLALWSVSGPSVGVVAYVPPLVAEIVGLVLRVALFAAAFAWLALRAGLIPPQDRAVVLAWLKLEPLRRRVSEGP